MPQAWPALSSFLSLLVSLVALAAGQSARAAVHTETVAGTGDKTCQAYFHFQGDAPRWPVVLSLKGTGIYTTGLPGRVEGAVRGLYAQGRVTVVTLDKPGIRAVPDSVAKLTVVDSTYNRYVQEDLVHCASEALEWLARARGGVGPVLLSGHSEGSQVALRLVAQLSRDQHPLAAQVRALFLSGLPLGTWRGMLSRQLPAADSDRFFLAFEQRDDRVLRRFGNLTRAYLEHVFQQDTLAETLDHLASRGFTAPIFIYQGLKDRNTPARPVQEYAARNAAAARAGTRLQLHATYYRTDHGLNAQAVRDIARDVTAQVEAIETTLAAGSDARGR